MKTCPICKKQFKDKAALKQHMLSHQQQPKQPRVSKSKSSNQGVMSLGAQIDPVCRVNRIDWIKSVSFGTSATSVGAMETIQPNDENLPVISKLAAIWDKFVVHSIALIYRGGCSSMRDGMIYLAFDYDGATKQVKAVSDVVNKPYVCGPLWSKELRLQLRFDSQVRYCAGTDLRDKLGNICLFATTNAEAKGITVGEVFVHYDITFSGLSVG